MVATLTLDYSNSSPFTDSSTNWVTINQTADGSNQESDVPCVYRSSGIGSQLWMNVTTNTKGATITIKFRKNSGNGNQTFSIGSNTTGVFTDAVHTDSINAGDTIDIQLGFTTSGNFLPTIISFTFAATTNTVSRTGTTNLNTYSTASKTFFSTPIGNDFAAQTLEPQCKNRQRRAMTIKNCQVFVFSNSNTNAATVHSRKNGANGNLSVSIGAGTTGNIEDTTHSDSVAAGDDFCYSCVTGAGTVSMEIDLIFADFISTNGDGILSICNDSNQSVNTSVTTYWGLAGDLTTSINTESQAQGSLNMSYAIQELTINVQTNGITNASTLTLRANTTNTGATVSIIASTTGVFSDSIDIYNSNASDLLNYKLVTASTGTTMKFSHMSVWTNLPIGAPGTTTQAGAFVVISPTGLRHRAFQSANQFTTFGA